MRTLQLSKNGINKVRARHLELKISDFETSIKSLIPGEWCLIKVSNEECWVGFINPLIEEKFSCAHLVKALAKDEMGVFSIESFIVEKLNIAVNRRRKFLGYETNARVFYGSSDGLPGLLIDQFENAAIIQINTAGIDQFRELIKLTISNLLQTTSYLLDNSKYREKESLPTFNCGPLPELKIKENGLHYLLRSEVLQKVGFYYDHRENRYQLMNLISRLSHKPKNGLDLFSYAGAWGINALKAGVKNIEFVDQGDFSYEVLNSLKLNGFEGQGLFHRKDVFKFLDESIQEHKTFDLILCDPPAFAKSSLQKTQAIEGYSKLHRKVFKALSKNGLVAFSSCTHYVGHEEFQKNILDAAIKEKREIQLVYTGMQGFDHPVSSLNDRSSYIKSYFFIVE